MVDTTIVSNRLFEGWYGWPLSQEVRSEDVHDGVDVSLGNELSTVGNQGMALVVSIVLAISGFFSLIASNWFPGSAWEPIESQALPAEAS